MYSTQFISFGQQHYDRCQKLFPYYSFKFDLRKQRFIPVNSSGGGKRFKLLLLVMLLYTLAVSGHLHFGAIPLARKFQGFVFCIMYFLIIGSCRNYE